ncbi:hypothetical protein AMECASPLE_005705 [Ameca splendens]|uniref:Uncharacterized protein n=1 Tax=Ameca splendens TaxID=208324 RepID=A0ABV0YX73_9TELE
MSNRILALSFSTTFSGVSPFYCGTFSTFSARTFLYTIPSTSRMLYLPPSRYCGTSWSVSWASLPSMHLGSCQVWYTLVSIVLVLMACSCAAMIDASVLSFGVAFTSH